MFEIATTHIMLRIGLQVLEKIMYLNQIEQALTIETIEAIVAIYAATNNIELPQKFDEWRKSDLKKKKNKNSVAFQF
jgi:hypothetical protein